MVKLPTKPDPIRPVTCFVCRSPLVRGVLHYYCPECMRWVCFHKPSIACPVGKGGKPVLHPVPDRSWRDKAVDAEWRDEPEALAPSPPKLPPGDDWWD